MARPSKLETNVVYGAGLAQGIVLVTFPAASTIFTDPSEYGLSSTQYGGLFLPQVIMAIIAALLGASLGGRFGTKRVYLAGLAASLVSMSLLLASAPVKDEQTLAYVLLLLATTFLGAGFGLTVPALNTFAAAFHPGSINRAILVLNALLGLGTVLAPVFVAIFDGLGFWWGLPLTSTALLVLLLLVSLRLPLRADVRRPAREGARTGIPRRFWVFAGFAVLYGVCETVSGNWLQLDMTTELGASTTAASLALTAFWGMVTVGRVLFAAIQSRLPPRVAYHLLPFVLAGAFGIVALLPHDTPALGVLAFALAGLGCSALLPLTIGFGQEELTTISAAVAGGVSPNKCIPRAPRRRRVGAKISVLPANRHFSGHVSSFCTPHARTAQRRRESGFPRPTGGRRTAQVASPSASSSLRSSSSGTSSSISGKSCRSSSRMCASSSSPAAASVSRSTMPAATAISSLRANPSSCTCWTRASRRGAGCDGTCLRRSGKSSSSSSRR